MIIIIGSGIIGSWIAYTFAKNGKDVYIVEKEKNPGDGISGRNSGVLHSGIYYDPKSLKSKVCLSGYDLALSFLEEHKVPFKICGKLITTGLSESDEEENAKRISLEALIKNGELVGIKGLEVLENIRKQFPFVNGSLAIWNPKTGVVDVPEYLKALWRACEANGVQILKNKKLVFHEGNPYLKDVSTSDLEEIEADLFVNAGGLYSDELSSAHGIDDYEIRPNKGEYFRLRKSLPEDLLIYPLPLQSSTALGVHYTFNLGGDAYAGPNSNWAKNKEDYTFQTDRKTYFESLQKILNCYKEEDLSEGYVGIRPRLFHKGEPLKDFQILKKDNWIHLLGIESPGLTSAPGLAVEVWNRSLSN